MTHNTPSNNSGSDPFVNIGRELGNIGQVLTSFVAIQFTTSPGNYGETPAVAVTYSQNQTYDANITVPFKIRQMIIRNCACYMSAYGTGYLVIGGVPAAAPTPPNTPGAPVLLISNMMAAGGPSPIAMLQQNQIVDTYNNVRYHDHNRRWINGSINFRLADLSGNQIDWSAGNSNLAVGVTGGVLSTQYIVTSIVLQVSFFE